MGTSQGIQPHVVSCKRCSHKWATRRKKPVRCAACRSPYWNRKPGSDEPEQEALTKEEFLAQWLERRAEVGYTEFMAEQEVDFGEGWKLIEASSLEDEETAMRYLRVKVARYRREQAERQVIQAGGVEQWYASMSPAWLEEWSDLKQSLLVWEREGKESQDHWRAAKSVERPPVVVPQVPDAQPTAEQVKQAEIRQQQANKEYMLWRDVGISV